MRSLPILVAVVVSVLLSAGAAEEVQADPVTMVAPFWHLAPQTDGATAAQCHCTYASTLARTAAADGYSPPSPPARVAAT